MLQAGKSTFIKQLKVIQAESAGQEAFSEDEIKNCRKEMAANIVSAVLTLAENVGDSRKQVSPPIFTVDRTGQGKNEEIAEINKHFMDFSRLSFLNTGRHFKIFMLWKALLNQIR